MSKRNWILAGVIAGFAALLCCVAGVVAGVAYVKRETPERVVAQYLTALQEHDRSRAAEFTCDGMRNGMAGKLLGLAQNWSEIVEWEITEVESGRRAAEVSTRITYKVAGVASTTHITFTVTDEERGWRVCGFRMVDTTKEGVNSSG